MQPTTEGTRHAERAERALWGVPMTMGILMIICGVIAFLAAVFTSFVSVYFLGTLLVIVGIIEVIAAFRHRRTSGSFGAYFLTGLLSLVVGLLMLWRPFASLSALTMLIAGLFFADGLFRGITAIADRYPRWGWDLAYGVFAALLGVYVVATFPFSALWVLGTLVAAEIFARGIALVAASSALHHRIRDQHITSHGTFAGAH